jgi:DNA-binding transcriptional ArsR family regulator
MNPEKDTSVEIKRLASEKDYFTNVFKRTEKIISVIFYILSHTTQSDKNQGQIDVLKDRALKTHEASLATLRLEVHQVQTQLPLFQFNLVDLESTLRLCEATDIIPSNLAQLLYEQLDGVQRYMQNHYLSDNKIDFNQYPSLHTAPVGKPNKTLASSTPTATRKKTVRIPSGDISTDAYMVYSQLTDRAARIRTVLEAKPQATIKDIAEIITDVSEKTIQRELNSLIEKGQVIREGERRWSKYSYKK